MENSADRKAYTYWTAEDRERLAKVARECTRNGKIDWDSVGE